MIKVSYVSTTFKNNECFERDGKHNRDSFLDFLVNLKYSFYTKGYELDTDDILKPSDANISIHANIRSDFKERLSKFNILIIFESEAILPENFDLDNHKYFDVVLTWSDMLLSLDPIKYQYINYSHNIKNDEIRSIVNSDISDRNRKVMISGNKKCRYHNELYSERERVVDWYLSEDKNDFDLYGIRWGLKLFEPNIFTNKLNSLNLKFGFLKRNLKVYKGSVNSKFEIYKKYKFAYCFENAKDIDGYITEKIFDCMRCGIVPIYFGAESIRNYIPEGCYISYTDFDGIQELDSFLNNIGDDEYRGYQKSMKKFFESEGYYKFSSEYFSEKLISVVRGFS
ncbi:glycosyltransferase family 10 domain-containing protein [Vibrio splendidus]|uniref:glycosyltransferase family 10 domain-containing protein n=1 Tax=Vibrio splendidus TaxID=29497 RepID=UPI0011B6C6D1|nr:glycosyltransferase family 10 [Vibrio splendidus]